MATELHPNFSRNVRHDDEAAQLKSLVQEFVRNFGLLVTKQTPCGHPISPSYAHALMVLLERENAGLESSQSDLGSRLSIDKSNITRLCGKLEADGNILQNRSATDGRSRLLGLTPKGRRMAERLESASHERFKQVLMGVPSHKRRPLLAALELLGDAVQALSKSNAA